MDDKPLLDRTLAEVILGFILKRPALLSWAFELVSRKVRLDEGINHLLAKLDLPAYPTQRSEAQEILRRLEAIEAKLAEVERLVGPR